MQRPLLQRLHDALLTHRVTVISAPAGYGKTSLLGGLAQQYPKLPLAWLSLDALDAEEWPGRDDGAALDRAPDRR